MDRLCTFQPAIGSVDHPQTVYLARGADLTNTAPDINETQHIAWFSLDEAVAMIEDGQLVGASTVVALYRELSLTVTAEGEHRVRVDASLAKWCRA